MRLIKNAIKHIKYSILALEAKLTYPKQREGQAMMNVIRKKDPDLFNLIASSKHDVWEVRKISASNKKVIISYL